MNTVITAFGYVSTFIACIILCLFVCSLVRRFYIWIDNVYNKNKKKTYIIKYAVNYPVVRCNGTVKMFKYEFSELEIEQIVVRGKNVNDAIRRMNHKNGLCSSLIIISITETETI